MLAKTVGRGTALLERALPGAEVDVLGPLGTSFPAPDAGYASTCWSPAGWGCPPCTCRASWRRRRGWSRAPRCSTAGAARTTSCCCDEMRAMGVALHLTTEDGSVGTKGLVTRALEARLRRATAAKRVRVMGCGPNAMLWAVGRIAREREIPCFISLEEQMACGIGVCLGCAIPARSRPFRYVCSNGPVFDWPPTCSMSNPSRPRPPAALPRARRERRRRGSDASVELAIETGGIAFRNPVLTASGTFGYGARVRGAHRPARARRPGHEGHLAQAPLRQRDAAHLRDGVGHAQLDRPRERRRRGLRARQAALPARSAARACW